MDGGVSSRGQGRQGLLAPGRRGAAVADGRRGSVPRRGRRPVLATLIVVVLSAVACGGDAPSESPSAAGATSPPSSASAAEARVVMLPAPSRTGPLSLEQTLAKRRSVREYSAAELTVAQLGQLLWAAQGISRPVEGRRTAPSAGALYPLEVRAVVARVAGLAPGVYHYVPAGHMLRLEAGGAAAARLSAAALSQTAVRDAPLTLAVTAVMSRTTAKYGERGRRYVYMEAGHAAQNVCLQAVALGLGAVTIGAFDDGAVSRVLELPEGEEPLYLLPVGEPASP